MSEVAQELKEEKSRSVVRIGLKHYLVLVPIAIIHRLWCMTLRFNITDTALQCLRNEQEASIILFWHNRLFVINEIYRRYRRSKNRQFYSLISASKDGAWLSAYCHLMGFNTIRGSSSFRGGAALLGLVKVMKAGHDVGITPDGPRGPCYGFKPGAVALARKEKKPVIMLGIKYSRAQCLKNWDGFQLPHPFAQVNVDVKFCSAEAVLNFENDEAAASWAREQMLHVNGESDSLEL